MKDLKKCIQKLENRVGTGDVEIILIYWHTCAAGGS
jgi:hypothetical protein